MNFAERVRLLSRRYTPELPEPVMTCAWAYSRALADGRHEYKCSQCGDTQLVTALIGATEKRVCRGSRA